jgi:hypothetical protein
MGLPAAARVLEPTCGTGGFLQAASVVSPGSERIGVEVQATHARRASQWGTVLRQDIFSLRPDQQIQWRSDGPLCVVGNPPWVTSAELGRLNSGNLPVKENFKGAKGLDAVLGGANFDVCEYIILKLIDAYRDQRFALGMLCKTHVARNVMSHAAAARWPMASSAVYRIDAKKWFDAGVDACWFTVEVDSRRRADYTTPVYDDLFAPDARPSSRFGTVDGRLVSDIDRYRNVRRADGHCPYEWRSGLKHDASSVFELVATPEPATRAGRRLDLEPEYVYPFLKSTDVFRDKHRVLSKWVIVPQRSFGDDTAQLRYRAPKLWLYLLDNSLILDGRKSSIYRHRPRFSVFGHGPYTYAPYKVTVSGLHKEPVFRLVAPIERRPVVLDDTCYFLPFTDPAEALVVTAMLNSEQCRDLIESLVFWDSKRPITKKLLARIDLRQLGCDRGQTTAIATSEARRLGLTFDPDAVDGLFADASPELADALF